MAEYEDPNISVFQIFENRGVKNDSINLAEHHGKFFVLFLNPNGEVVELDPRIGSLRSSNSIMTASIDQNNGFNITDLHDQPLIQVEKDEDKKVLTLFPPN